MKFGTKSKDVPVYTGGEWIRTFKKGETTLRFLQECDDWVVFREHYSHEGKSFPCTTERDTCPGCTDPSEKVSRSSRKYAANVIIQPQGYQAVIKMPVTVANRFESRSERNNGTITSRDYVVIKSGDGLDTEYDVENGDKYEVDIESYPLFDIENMLREAFEANTGISLDDQTPPEDKQKELPEDPPSEPQPQSDTGAEEQVITENQLRKMTFLQLFNITKESSLDVPDTITEKDELVDYILDKLS